MQAFFQKHFWYLFFGVLAAATSAVALLISPRQEMYFSISLKPVLFLYYFAVCLVGFFLLDRYLFKKKYFLYALLLAALLAVSSGIAAWLAPIVFIGSTRYSWFLHVIGIGTLLGISAFLRLLKERIQNKAEYNEYKARRAEAELKLLKQQLNPHFLFNTLNSVYAQCLEDRAEAGDMVLQLSDMLRYQLEADKQATISLSDEIAFIDNYIFFEQRRLPQGYIVDYQKQVSTGDMTLAPLLLITLVENCFKHGVRLQGSHRIQIHLALQNKQLSLQTINPVLPKLTKPFSRIGLENLQKRLELLYPGRFVLENNVQNDMYHAKLEISL